MSKKIKLFPEEEMTVTLSQISKGEFFRFPGRKRVLIYLGKVRMYNRWGEYKGWGFEYNDYEHGDHANPLSTRINKVIEIGFTY